MAHAELPSQALSANISRTLGPMSSKIAERLAANDEARELGQRWCEYIPGRGCVWHEMKGWSERLALQSEREDRLRRQLKAAGIPALFADASFAKTERGFDFERHDGNRRAAELCERLANEWVLGHKGLTLGGPFGCGKTFLAQVVLRSLIGGKTTKCRAVTVPDLLQKYRDSYSRTSDDPYTQTPNQVFAEFAECDVLLLDDLGAERSAAGEKGEWAREQVFRIVNHRHENKLTTLATTNLSKEQMNAERLGGRIVSRLLGRSPYIFVDGPDYRQIQDADDPFAQG